MIKDFFKTINVYSVREDSSDDLGGFETSYVFEGTIQGLLERASTTERLIAAQLGVKSTYTLMTCPEDNRITLQEGYIVEQNGVTARISSDELKGQEESEEMGQISQWTADSYVMSGRGVV